MTNIPTHIMSANLDRVAEGLRSLRANLKASGYEEAAGGYRQMKHVLLQQRLLSLSVKDPTLMEKWESIQREAASVTSLLQPFLSVMEEIERIAGMNGISQPAAPQEDVG